MLAHQGYHPYQLKDPGLVVGRVPDSLAFLTASLVQCIMHRDSSQSPSTSVTLNYSHLVFSLWQVGTAVPVIEKESEAQDGPLSKNLYSDQTRVFF